MGRMMSPNTAVWFVPAAGMSTLGGVGNNIAKASDINTNGTQLAPAIDSKGYAIKFKPSMVDKTHTIADSGNIDTPTLADYEAKFAIFRDSLGTAGTASPVITGAANTQLTAPVLSAPSTATTGGTLAAATYFYKATYTNTLGETVGSNEVSQVTTGTTSTVTFTLAAAPAGATGTKIYRSTTTGTEVLLDTLVTTPTSYTDNGSKVPGSATVPVTNTTGGTFTAGTYFWVVSATSATGESIVSNEVTATIALNGAEVLNWTAVTGATGYKVYRGTVSGAENTLVATLGAVLTYTDTGIAGTVGAPPFNTTAYTKALNIFSAGRVTGYLIVRQGYLNSVAAAAGHSCNIFKVTSDFARQMEGKPGEPVNVEMEFFPQGESYSNQTLVA